MRSALQERIRKLEENQYRDVLATSEKNGEGADNIPELSFSTSLITEDT